MYDSGHGDLEVRYLVKKKEDAELLVMFPMVSSNFSF